MDFEKREERKGIKATKKEIKEKEEERLESAC